MRLLKAQFGALAESEHGELREECFFMSDDLERLEPLLRTLEARTAGGEGGSPLKLYFSRD